MYMQKPFLKQLCSIVEAAFLLNLTISAGQYPLQKSRGACAPFALMAPTPLAS